jgi:polyferredoxin
MIPKTLRNVFRFGIPASILLAQPACAAVCPRGIGDCRFPGKCLLYTDADGNSLCDYTRGIVTRSTTDPASAVTAVHSTPTVQAPDVVTIVSDSGSSGVSGFFHSHPYLMWALLFAVITGALALLLFWHYRKRGGVTVTYQMVLAVCLSIGISGMVTSVATGETIPGATFALVYCLSGIPLVAYLWMKRNLPGSVALAILSVSTVAGFVFLAPLMPAEFAALISLATGTGTIAPGIVAMIILIIAGFLIGRIFCGHFCPVGTLQELVSHLKVKKFGQGDNRIPEAVRAGVFITAVACGIFSINLMARSGVYDLFSLSVTAGFFLFGSLILLSAFVYRPVCRYLCPFGLIFSLPAHFSTFRLRRSDACISCGKCEKVCPAGVANRDSSKRECYLCGRCTRICPVEGALLFGRGDISGASRDSRKS